MNFCMLIQISCFHFLVSECSLAQLRYIGEKTEQGKSGAIGNMTVSMPRCHSRQNSPRERVMMKGEESDCGD